MDLLVEEEEEEEEELLEEKEASSPLGPSRSADSMGPSPRHGTSQGAVTPPCQPGKFPSPVIGTPARAPTMPDLSRMADRDWSPARDLFALGPPPPPPPPGTAGTAGLSAGIRRAASAVEWSIFTQRKVAVRARRETYAETPFLSVHGFQQSEQHTATMARNRSMASAVQQYGATSTADLHATDSELQQAVAERPLTGALLAAVTTACIQAVLLGISISSMNSLEAVVFPGHLLSEWSVAVSCFALGAVIGAGLAPPFANSWGRKRALQVSGFGFFIAGILMAGASHIHMLVAGRLLVGISSGWSAATIPVRQSTQLESPHAAPPPFKKCDASGGRGACYSSHRSNRS